MKFAWGTRTFVMGILNATPDSFSGDGLLAQVPGDSVHDDARHLYIGRLARKLVEDGADIIDIGGESTRPGSFPVSLEEELARVIPAVRAVREAVGVPISVDTYRAVVAERAIAAGAEWVNDVWGLRMDAEMAAVVAGNGCNVVLMHNRSKPKNVAQENRLGGRYVGIHYDDLFEDIKQELQQSVDLALNAGIAADNIVIDPGIGFGKSIEQNVRIVNELQRFRDWGFPVLIGPSRKSFIGYTLDLEIDERIEGTAATVAIGIDRGADIVRVHDVKQIVRVARMTDRIVRGHKQ